ncbi:MAG TPA: hypothetical protein VK571_02380 [Gemmatimonadaceae bacterium]|nr:hypothetical protein [Gemmatimonadaceae bacterium]
MYQTLFEQIATQLARLVAKRAESRKATYALIETQNVDQEILALSKSLQHLCKASQGEP